MLSKGRGGGLSYLLFLGVGSNLGELTPTPPQKRGQDLRGERGAVLGWWVGIVVGVSGRVGKAVRGLVGGRGRKRVNG